MLSHAVGVSLVCACVLSQIQLFVIACTVACQASFCIPYERTTTIYTDFSIAEPFLKSPKCSFQQWVRSDNLLGHENYSHHLGSLEVNSPSYHCEFSSVQSLSRVWLFATPCTAAHQASLSVTNSWSLLKFMSIESVMPSNYLLHYCEDWGNHVHFASGGGDINLIYRSQTSLTLHNDSDHVTETFVFIWWMKISLETLREQMRVVPSACLRLLIFLPVILISACDSSRLAFHEMHVAWNLNMQADNI